MINIKMTRLTQNKKQDQKNQVIQKTKDSHLFLLLRLPCNKLSSLSNNSLFHCFVPTDRHSRPNICRLDSGNCQSRHLSTGVLQMSHQFDMR